MKTSDIMTLGAATIAQDAPLSRAVRILRDHRISALPVVDSNDLLVGLISEADFFRSSAPALAELLAMDADKRADILNACKVEEIMSRNLTTIGPDAAIEEAVKLMEQNTLKRIPVVSNSKVVGMLSRADLLRALID